MPKTSAVLVAILLGACGSMGGVRAEDTSVKGPNAEQGKTSGWKDPQPKSTPSANTDDRSRERRSALEERVRYLEEQAAAMARDLEAERLRRAALETSAAAARREADELKAKERADQLRQGKANPVVEDRRPMGRTRQASKIPDGNKTIVRSSFSLPGALRPIKF